MNQNYLLGEILGYIIITYVIYWIIKKLVVHRIKKPVNTKQRIIIGSVAIAIQFLLILQATIRT